MLKFVDCGSKFLKANVRFEIITFKIGYWQNLLRLKIWSGLETGFGLFDPKCSYLVIWAKNPRKPISDLK